MRPAAQISGPVSAWEAGGRERMTLGPVQVCGGLLGSIHEVSPWLRPLGSTLTPRIDGVLCFPAAAGPVLSPGGQESDLSKVRHKLRRFLQRRPTLQSLREKGYIRGMAARPEWAAGHLRGDADKPLPQIRCSAARWRCCVSARGARCRASCSSVSGPSRPGVGAVAGWVRPSGA